MCIIKDFEVVYCFRSMFFGVNPISAQNSSNYQPD